MIIEKVEMPVSFIPPAPEDDAPVSFPIPGEDPDNTKVGEEPPMSFPIPVEDPDNTRIVDDMPVSFPIDPIPDDTGTKG
ncbi:MAG: hypothetical protein NTW74_17080 [Acidobacteria bacterium]|nr:hypothetical protein [Acidobacteriota bacterium]